jgi:diadenosine tetraphosphatase ApaH/serine/threonine PP2A family protein phosphatase
MRIAVVSDIHANLAALDAVLNHAEVTGPIDAVWNIGDAVGYGPQPAEGIARLRAVNAVWVAGNHERAVSGAIDTSDFNDTAAAAAEWTAKRLSDGDKQFLDTLPETIIERDFVLVHGTLRWPIWEYLYDPDAARAHLTLMTVPFSIVGHTHVPLLVREDVESPEGCRLERLFDGDTVALEGDAKLVLNPGSVGQPRDGDSRASYGIYDETEATFTLHRVEYDIESTQELMKDAGLPRWLYERLARGR